MSIVELLSRDGVATELFLKAYTYFI
jgi:hypothetical protein